MNAARKGTRNTWFRICPDACLKQWASSSTGTSDKLPRQLLDRLRSADLFHHAAEFLIRLDFRRHVEQNGKFARKLQTQPHLRVAGFPLEQFPQRLRLVGFSIP